jgi:hypothetical protein
MDRIQAAVKWWADLLQKPVLQDNGDIQQSVISSFFAIKAFKEFSPEEVENFSKRLEGILRSKPQSRIVLTVDYHPCLDLQDAAACLGSKFDDMLTFPCKTTMWIEEDKVAVSCGYCAEEETIWSKSRQ